MNDSIVEFMNVLVNATRHAYLFFLSVNSDKKKVRVNSIKFETAEKTRVARPKRATFSISTENDIKEYNNFSRMELFFYLFLKLLKRLKIIKHDRIYKYKRDVL